ncbi:MAG: penicillin-binding protein 2 [Armatimonadetes bacterium]|nr:penicillin-binding protein 2 [Armatimonadota bacterium]
MRASRSTTLAGARPSAAAPRVPPFPVLLKKRTEWGFALIALAFVGLAGQLVNIQVRHHAHYKQQADKYHNRRIPLPAARGILRDRNGNSFTQNLPLKAVVANPRRVKDPVETARQLAPLLDLSAETLEQRLRREGSFVYLRRKVDRKTEQAVQALNLEGIHLEPVICRAYPHKSLAANVIGFTDIDGQGIEGLERQLQRTVAGTDGWVWAEVDALQRTIPGTVKQRVEAVDGYNVVLTLDTRIQHLAETAIEKVYTAYQAAGVCAVVLDPRTGEILAMANRPTYDPNRVADSTAADRRNRCVTDLYEPGSTLKAITVAAALQEKQITASTTFGCSGIYPVGRRRIRCVLHAPYYHGHGAQTIRGILRESCNIGTAQIAARLGARRLYRYIADFGFIGDTRAGIIGEQRGSLDPPSSWSAIRLANVGFGQGVSVTPLQVATAYAAIANGGKLMQPYLISRVEDSSGKVIQEYRPRVVRQVISPEVARTVTECLKAVVEDGTGKTAQLEGYTLAGKTGSAQKVKAGRGYTPGCFVASFIGYAPADNPRVVAIVTVDEPKGSHWGATTAAPAFREILQGALWCLKVPPDRPVDLKRTVLGRRPVAGQ